MMQAKRFTVDASWRAILDSLNLNVVAILQEAQLPIDLFQKDSISLSTEEYFKLWEAVAKLISPDISLPKTLFEVIDFNRISPPIMAAICSADFEACVRRIQEFKPLIGPLILDVSINEFDFCIAIKCIDPAIVLHPLIVAVEMVFFTKLIRHGTGKELVPRLIETREPLDHPDYIELFGMKPVRGEQDRIIFARKDSRMSFQTKNESLWSFFEPELRKRLHELEMDTSFSAKVRSVLIELLPLGKSDIEAVAQKLIVSKRTLQRRLQSEKTNYQKQLNHSRELLARNYLLHSDMTSTEIAFLIGYDDPSSFSRAFHIWTGMTPEALRVTAT